MTSGSNDSALLLEKAREGPNDAIGALFDHYRERLRRMVRLRLDRRLSGKVSSEAVLHVTFQEVARQFPEYVRESPLPVFLWLREMTGRVLKSVHRAQLGSRYGSDDEEVSLHRGALPPANSVSLAAHFLGKVSSAGQEAILAEHRLIVQEALNSMVPLDREVLTLRHFERMSNDEAALVLGLSPGAASIHYIRALKRIKEILSAIPGLIDQIL
jgi:RNA polymerase sigma-70 factor (ECF subfamily)